jgi:isopenicillin N synthase-like dioxygenase
MIINGGDYLNILSNGKYHSPIHRVLCPIDNERFSFVFFFYPAYDSEIKPFGQLEINRNQRAEVEIDGFEFNTLLKSKKDINSDPPLFGDYIQQKWGDVFRDDSSTSY